jgi:hypothetical protein
LRRRQERYVPIVDPEHIWNDEDYVVNSLIGANSISPAMQSCASTGYFFSAGRRPISTTPC